jgi:hypothetical protein
VTRARKKKKRVAHCEGGLVDALVLIVHQEKSALRLQYDAAAAEERWMQWMCLA